MTATSQKFYAVADTFVSVARHGSRWGCYMELEDGTMSWIGEWSPTKATAVAYAQQQYPLPAKLVADALFARQAARDARKIQEDYYTAPGFNHARYAEIVDAKKLADSEWSRAMDRVDANSEAADLYQEAVNPPPAPAPTTYDPTSDAATYCRHNGHYCPGCPCECHTAPAPSAPLAAPTCVYCAQPVAVGFNALCEQHLAMCIPCVESHARDEAPHVGCVQVDCYCYDCHADPQTPAAREAATVADLPTTWETEHRCPQCLEYWHHNGPCRAYCPYCFAPCEPPHEDDEGLTGHAADAAAQRAYYLGGVFHDWQTGAVLDHYTGRVMAYTPYARDTLMHTWFEDGARCWAVAQYPEPTPALPAYNPEDGAPCAQCGHGQELHYSGVAECWASSDTTPPVYCPCPGYQAHEAAQRADEADTLPEWACWRCQTLEDTSIDGSGRYVCGVCLYIGDREELDAAEPCYRCHQRGGAKVYAQDMGYRHVTCPPTRTDEAELQAGLLATLPPMAGGSDSGGPSHRQAHSFVLTDAYTGLPRYCRVVERIGTRHTLSCGHQTQSPSTLYHPGAPMPCLPCTQAYKALAARGLPPMAGGAPSHYDDPAWYADEAWHLQEERNAESAREAAEAEHTHFCPTCHQARPCTGTGCADGPRECANCSNCRGW